MIFKSQSFIEASEIQINELCSESAKIIIGNECFELVRSTISDLIETFAFNAYFNLKSETHKSKDKGR